MTTLVNTLGRAVAAIAAALALSAGAAAAHKPWPETSCVAVRSGRVVIDSADTAGASQRLASHVDAILHPRDGGTQPAWRWFRFEPAPLGRCRMYVNTDFHVLTRLAGSTESEQGGHERVTFLWELGVSHNIGAAASVGLAGLLAADCSGWRAGVGMRSRRWIGGRAYVEIGVGGLIAAGPDRRSPGCYAKITVGLWPTLGGCVCFERLRHIAGSGESGNNRSCGYDQGWYVGLVISGGAGAFAGGFTALFLSLFWAQLPAWGG